MSKTFNNQCNIIIERLKNGKSITTAEAVTELGINSLSRRICDLQKQGFSIKKERVHALNKYGDKINYIRYSMEEYNGVAQ